MRILIDTNVLVSAARGRGIANRLVLHVVRHGEFDWLATEEILAEYWRVIARPRLGLLPGQLVRWQQLVRKRVTVLPSELTEFPFEIRDPKDTMWVHCAIGGQADCVITGDLDFESLKGVVPFRIVSPAAFLASIDEPAWK